MNLTEKILKAHLIEGELIKNKEIKIRIDQTLTQDVTAVMAYNAFMEMGKDTVSTKSVSYIDHNLLQTDYRTTDDHIFLKSVAEKYGIYFSKAGNGICHSIHLSRFTVPGETLIGTDSHTPMAGAAGMLAIGTGGVDAAMAMAGKGYKLKMPEVINIKLTGKLKNGVNAKDLALELLKMLTVKGAVNKILEYSGEGLENLSIFERGTIANMGAEMGATSSVFPSDKNTYNFFKIQGRLDDFKYLKADDNAVYDEVIEIDMSKIKSNVAMNDSPDKVYKVEKVKGIKISQIFIGSCTNSSAVDIKKVWEILKGKKISENVELIIAAGTKANYLKLLEEGIIEDLLKTGARFTESACGPCNGIGFSPATDTVSLRTINRNFKGRCGNANAKVYLVSPETAAASALKGELTSVEELKIKISEYKEEDYSNDEDIIKPLTIEKRKKVEIKRTENIKKIPVNTKPENSYKLSISIKTNDNITTDDICPTNANLSALRSNIEELSKYTFSRIDKDFYKRAEKMGKSVIIAGENYGQGSSREHAAINVMYLGVKFVIAKSFARIHRLNLINHGVMPLIFANKSDYEKISENDIVVINNYIDNINNNEFSVEILNKCQITVRNDLTDYERKIIKNGGLINMIKEENMERTC